MKRLLTSLILLGAFSHATPALADSALYAPCASCHGDRAQGMEVLFAPPLAGQNAAYLAEQLHNYRSGARGTHPDDLHGQVMAANAMPLTDQDIHKLAAHLAGLDPRRTEPAPGDAENGQRLYADHCLACHGVTGEGVPPLYSANLRILGAAYISRQWDAYRKGWRGDGQTGTTRSKSMRSIVPQLNSDSELEDLIAYLTR